MKAQSIYIKHLLKLKNTYSKTCFETAYFNVCNFKKRLSKNMPKCADKLLGPSKRSSTCEMSPNQVTLNSGNFYNVSVTRSTPRSPINKIRE